MKKIVAIIERHSPGCFTVEDENGDQFIVQLAFQLEEAWNNRKLSA
jgi:hypothetical protein